MTSNSMDELVGALRNTLKENERIRLRLAQVEERDREPIAIVGMACRYPGDANSPEALWQLLSDGTDATGGLPTDRGWDPDALYDPNPERVGRTYSRGGGFLRDPYLFDNDFFAIPPREATAMDPHQRLLLETSWEAFERAGIRAESVRDSQTGVYMGVSYQDHISMRTVPPGYEGYVLTGNIASVVSGRISYSFGLRGPAVTVDTACSSSLVALHLATQALRSRECSLALVGGATVMSGPVSLIEFSRQRGIAADGRCKAFGADADGMGWAEGVGVLVVERLSDARRNGHRVLAVVKGSALNQDGASNGLTAPNGTAQREVIKAALDNAGVSSSDIDVVEAHGTGTRLGDPIEAEALLAAYGRERTAETPLWIGSLKSNIGHPQAAAGVGGVIKMVMAMQHGILPKTLHAERPTPLVDWSAGTVRLLTGERSWPQRDVPRRAGVSGFGISGTNAHVILEEAPAEEPAAAAPPRAPEPAGPLPFAVTGRGAAGLRSQAGALRWFVEENPELAPADLGRSLVTTRAALPDRAVVVAQDRDGLMAALEALAAGEESASVHVGRVAEGRLAAVFTGQGAQRTGMGQELAARYPVFAAALDEVCGEVDELLGESLRDLMSGGGERLDRTEFAQPAIFAFEVALFRLAESWGIRPDFVSGHSIGEISAAHVAGVLSLADASRMVVARGRLMQALPTGGVMIAVSASEDAAAPLVAAADGVSLAAVNSPGSIVLSGVDEAVTAVAGQLAAAGHRTRRLAVSHAFHSALMDPMLAEFRDVVTGLTFAEPAIPVFSTVTGALADGAVLGDPEYWVRHARQTVRFADSVAGLHGRGVAKFLELGPDALLTAMVRECLPTGQPVLAVAATRRDRPETVAFVEAVGKLFAAGGDVAWSAVFPGEGRPVELPTYAFARKRFWLPRDGSVLPVAPAPEPELVARTTEVLAVADQHRVMLDLVRTSVSLVLGYDEPGDLDLGLTFQDLGFSSLAAVELRDRLNGALGLALAGTLAFDYPTPTALAAYLAGLVSDTAGDGPVVVATRAAEPDEPIAVVGIACRYPGGADSPELLWDLVHDGVDAVSELPADRGWDLATLLHRDPAHRGATPVRGGGFLDDLAEFDAPFFGISPREATSMDPQQRLLLELTWEALERAGIDPRSLRGTRTGVFAGTSDQDYAVLLRGSAELADGYLLTGTSAAVLAGRLSYQYGLEGPALTVDTACSSSLVAMHLAAQSLRSGESTLALAGGVTVMATPVDLQEFDKQGLAPDGRCKAFGAGADGTGFAEGAGLLVLERLSDARKHGHPVLAVLKGSAVNQDGASNGLTAPNGLSQQKVIRDALASAGLSPAEVDAVEGHGTGTVLGDPIEVGALQAAYGQHREDGAPLWLGSLKSNIGHSQAASGVGGVIKMIMAMRHGVLPKTLHADSPSTRIEWDNAVRLVEEAQPWPVTEHPRRAGVSSFGASGTNAHLIIEQAPASVPESEPRDDVRGLPVPPLLLSARDEAGLRGQAQRLGEHLGRREHLGAGELTDLAYSLARTRSHLEHRAVVTGADSDELLSALDGLATGATPLAGPVILGETRPVFVFPGQGGQYVGMALQLWDSSEVFAESMRECEAALAPYADWHGHGLRDLLAAADGAPDPDHAEQVQPMLFAVMVSLARTWMAHGVTPSAVVAHSVGEVAAAYIAGILSLADAARLVTARARVSAKVTGYGTVWLGLPVEQARERVAGLDGVYVTGINGPRSVVLTGPAGTMAELLADSSAAGIRARRIPMDYPTHSPHLAVVEDELAGLLAGISPATATVPYYSATLGRRVDGAELDGGYWFTNLVQPVLFQDATDAALADGHRVLLEIAPHPLLGPSVHETAELRGTGVTVLETLRRDDSGPDKFLRSLAEAWRAGLTVGWSEVFAGTGARQVDLPTYAFQRQHYWPTADASAFSDVTGIGLEPVDHPLFGAGVPLAGVDGLLFTSRLSLRNHPWLADHALFGRPLLPGTAFLELVVRAADEVGCGQLEELALEAPLVLSGPGDDVLVQVVVGSADDEGRRTIEVYSRRADADVPWTRHAQAAVAPGAAPEPDGWSAEAAWPPSGATELDVAGSYEQLAALGYGYGPAFRGLRRAWRQGEAVFAEAELPADLAGDATRYGLHPALLDAGQHSLAMARLDQADEGARVPFLWSGVRLFASGASAVRLVFTPTGPTSFSVDAFDLVGHPVLRADAMVSRELAAGQVPAVGPVEQDALFEIDWVECGTVDAAGSPDGWVTLGQGEERGLPGAEQYTGLADLASVVDSGAPVPEAVVLRVSGHQDGESAADAAHTSVNAVLAVLQQWVADERWEASLLVVVAPTGLAGAAVRGLVRSAQSENPDRVVLVGYDSAEPSGLLSAVASGEPEVTVRDGRLFSPRLSRVPAETAEETPEESPVWGDGTVLVTGASGVLGDLVARHLVTRCGVRRLLLVSRRGAAAPSVATLVGELTELGASVRASACDVSVRDEVSALLAELPADSPLSAVVHCAGTLDDGVLGSLTPDRVDVVLRPKVDGAWNLHDLTQELDLSAFVVFSSASGVLGGAGQANYAAANSFLDGLAVHRRDLGLPAVSIAWGWWAQASGMGKDLTTQDRARMARTGIRPVDNDLGLALFDAAVRRRGAVVAAPFDLVGLSASGTVPGLLRGLVRRPVRRVVESGLADAAASGLAGLPPEERDRAVAELVRANVAAVLGYASPDAIDDGQPFTGLGFDSLTVVELRNRLAAATGLRLPATLAFDYPSPRVLIDFLRETVGGSSASARPAAVATVAKTDDPIVIVGMACRYPGGVSSPDELWDLVAEGRDAIGEFPTNRGWNLAELYNPDPEHFGTSYTREGGFLHDADLFDADFWGISPREATSIDPQQRLLLETAWESLEHAGIDPAGLRGSATGVFVGVMYHDYNSRVHNKPEEFEGYLANGSAGSIASGRLSYEFGFEGPAVTVDTACSSSLVCLHLAVQALRSGECSLALAGGVTVMASPELYIEYSRLRALAKDGRSRAFGADAGGAGWAEGVGLLALERLSDAQRNGHTVLAVVAGSALNQDGASNGLTAPSGPSQQRVIRQALANAGLSPADVDAVEAHGTGTRLGDPIEAQALLAVYGQEHTEDAPLWLGSIKSNIGHSQAAAGAAGLIKMIMAMRYGRLPKTLHAEVPTPEVDWSSGAVSVLNEARDWPESGRPRRFGVSSFGVSGTNAHVIIEEPPAGKRVPAEPAAERVSLPFVVSARGPEALRGQAARLRAHLADRPDLSLADVAGSLLGERALHDHRGVVVAADRDELLDRLAALAGGTGGPGVATAAPGRGRLAVVFTGLGSQRPGWGRELYERFPVFAAAYDEVCALLDPRARAVVMDADGSGLDDMQVAQSGTFAVEVALFRLFESWGVRPDFVTGHSLGEIAAAHVAGVLSLPDACLLVSERGRLMHLLPVGGAMVSVTAGEDVVGPLVAEHAESVSIAAVNTPGSVVISGVEEVVDRIAARLAEDGHRTKKLVITTAGHSPLMDPMLDGFRDVVTGLTFSTPSISMLHDDVVDTEYWVRHVRDTVQFAGRLAALRDNGVTRFLEVGPDAALTGLISEYLDNWDDRDDIAHTVAAPGARRGQDEVQVAVTALGTLFAAGVPVEWPALLTGAGHVALPTYAFQRKRFWLDVPAGAANLGSVGLEDLDHPLLLAGVELAGSESVLLTGRLAADEQPWLRDHALYQRALLPGTGFVELAVRAADQVGLGVVEELLIEAPLVIPDEGGVALQVLVEATDTQGRRRITISGRQDGAAAETPWTRHASGALAPLLAADAAPEAPAEWPPSGAEVIDVSDAYDLFVAADHDYGPAFQGMVAAWRLGDELYAEAVLPGDAAEADGFGLHPALLDSGLHVGVLQAITGENPQGRVPFSWSGVRLFASGARFLRVRARPVAEGTVALDAFDTSGAPVFSVAALVTRPLSAGMMQGAATARHEPLFEVDWAERTRIDHTAGGLDIPVLDGADSLAALAGTPDVVALLAPRDGTDVVAGVHAAVNDVLRTAQTWLADPRWESSRLVVVTDDGLAGASVRGLLRSAQSENPERLILLDRGPGGVPAPAVLRAAAELGEPEVRLRDDGLWAPRLTRVPTAGTAEADNPWGSGTVLVTGASGTLAGMVARRLVAEDGVRHVLLASRRGGPAELVAELAGLGATVRDAACDVTDRDQVAALLGAVDPEHPLTGVVHCVGVLDDGVFGSLTADRVDTVLAPKVDGAWHLHELTQELDLAAFVLFSSTSGTLGGAGQANYAAANSFLDALAAHRHGQGLPAVSIAWGQWSRASGMASHLDGADLARISRSGILALDDDEGMEMFASAVRLGRPNLVAARFDLAGLRSSGTADSVPALLRGLVRRPARPVAQSSIVGSGLAGRTSADQRKALDNLVREQVAAVLGYSDDAVIDPSRAFSDIGFDSLTAVELRNRLSTATGQRLPATLVFDYPTPGALAEYLRAELLGEDEDAESGTAGPARAVAAADGDPIVIVGMACRYPGGVGSPDDLWDLVAQGRDAVAGFPANRGWNMADLYHPDPEHAGTTYAAGGGFLADVAGFDSDFFGISPREAIAIDPQQRMLLETAWESFEHAGIDPTGLRGGPTGVFIGANGADYPALLASDERDFTGRVLTGNAASIISGRLSYEFGFEGPAMSIDTACSSSLVAMHLAAQALRSGECSLALAGGVCALATPNIFVEMSRQRVLSADGRCRSFSAEAGGTGWAEGVGLLVLERLSDARRNGHQVLAVLAGSAVNQDGASNGLTAPNGPAQQRVIRRALANAGLSADAVDAVEAHGTGTKLGDPIEAQALLATYGREHSTDEPLWLGSLKSNIGHSQSAAGVGGVIKMVMAMRHGMLPKSLHSENPTPEVDWSSGAVVLLDEARAWPDRGRPRRVGVSSFGISGTNAHVILEQSPDELPAAVPSATGSVLPFVLSARGPEALRGQASRLRALLGDREGLSLLDVAGSLVAGRSVHDHRGVVLAADRDQLLARLAALADESSEVRTPGRGRLAVVFTGQGSQRAGMGSELYGQYPVFAEAFDEVCGFLEPGVRAAVLDGDGLDATEVAQPALFAIEVALFRLFESWGVEPDFVTGHSVGEIAAAHVAGVLSLPDACALVSARGRLMGRLPSGGVMVSVTAGEDVVAPLITGHAEYVSIAAVNTPGSVVISGVEAEVDQIAARLAEDGYRTKKLVVSHAFHSPLMEPMLDEFRATLKNLTFSQPRIAMTGDDEVADPEYWVRHVRDAVRFADAVKELHGRGATRFLELGPDAVLAGLVRDCLEGEDVTAVAALRRERAEIETALTALGTLFSAGVPVDWTALVSGAQRTALPTYAFHHQHYWAQAAKAAAVPEADGVDTRFWDLVDSGDLEALGGELAADERDGLGALLPALSRWHRVQTEKSVVDGWRYRLGWRTAGARDFELSALDGTWLLVVSAGRRDDPWTDSAEAALTAAGAAVRLLVVDEDGLDRAVLAGKLGDAPLAGVLSLLALDEARDPALRGAPFGLGATVTLVQALEDREIDVPLWCATTGAVSTAPGEGLDHPVQAMVWGLGRTVALELPRRWGGLVDLPVTPGDDAAAGLVRLLSGGGTGEQAAVRGDELRCARLAPAEVGDRPGRDWRPSGTVLVTGGLTGLGARTARWLAEQGAQHLVLTSRRGGESPGAGELKAELTALGASVTIAACDVADRAEVAAVLAALPSELPLTAVFHSAGVGDDGVLTAMSAERLGTVLRPKVDGAWNLHELTKELDLSAFVLFSSVAGLVGSPSQADYAAGNAFLNALADHRRALGLPATSVAWGLLAGDGMAGDASVTARAGRRGLLPMDPDRQLAGLRRALDDDETYLVVAHFDWTRYIGGLVGAAKCAVLRDLPEYQVAFPAPLAADAVKAAEGPEWPRLLAGRPADERDGELLDLIRAQVAEALGHDSLDAIPAGKALLELGFSSLDAVEFRNRLSERTGLPLSSTLTFDYPTPTAVRDHLGELLFGVEADAAQTALAELDRLEGLLSGVAGNADDASARGEVARRINRLAAMFSDPAGGSAPAELLDSADDGELFDFINRQFGGPDQ
jgi:acyl transferase domain-containing protein/acyl carrier protein